MAREIVDRHLFEIVPFLFPWAANRYKQRVTSQALFLCVWYEPESILSNTVDFACYIALCFGDRKDTCSFAVRCLCTSQA